MTKTVLGVDISKSKFDVALLRNNKIKSKKFDNNQRGFSQLLDWLTKYEIQDLHVCMEATGIYGEELATCLFESGYTVSVVNPAQIKGFAQSELARTKTDEADAKLIARFCYAINPKSWQPKPFHIRELQALVRRLEALQGMLLQETNRLEVSPSSVKFSIEAVISSLEKQIKVLKEKIKNHIDNNPDLRDKKSLLDTIPGVGEATIAQILAFMSNVEDFKNAKQFAAFIGLNPKHRRSGSSVIGKSHLSKIGDSNLRKALYMPAIVARRFNPVVKAFSDRLTKAGKPTMVIIGGAMRKLCHIIYGVLKNKKAFDIALAV